MVYRIAVLLYLTILPSILEEGSRRIEADEVENVLLEVIENGAFQLSLKAESITCGCSYTRFKAGMQDGENRIE